MKLFIILGQGYAFVWQNIDSDFLFNGNNISDNIDFDNYLKRLGINLKMKIKILVDI